MGEPEVTSQTRDLQELVSFVEELKRQWVATIDAIVDPIMLVNPDYSVRKANKAMADMAGLDIKELIGCKCFEIFARRQEMAQPETVRWSRVSRRKRTSSRSVCLHAPIPDAGVVSGLWAARGFTQVT